MGGAKIYRVSTSAITSHRYYLIYLPPSSIYGLDITIFQLLKPKYEEVI